MTFGEIIKQMKEDELTKSTNTATNFDAKLRNRRISNSLKTFLMI